MRALFPNATLVLQLVDYESTRRSAEGQKKGTPEYDRMQQKAVAMEGLLVSLTTAIHSDLNGLEARRSIDMKNELLSVVASEVSWALNQVYCCDADSCLCSSSSTRDARTIWSSFCRCCPASLGRC